MPKRSEKIIPPVRRALDRFALRAKRARNTLQPTQGSSPQMQRRKPVGIAGLPNTGGYRAGALEGAPWRRLQFSQVLSGADRVTAQHPALSIQGRVGLAF